jgi:hypothetical protein
MEAGYSMDLAVYAEARSTLVGQMVVLLAVVLACNM